MDYHTKEKIDKLIDYKEDSINAKVLSKKEDCALLLIALKKNQLMAEHTSPVDAYLYVIEGAVEYKTKNESYEIEKGEIFSIKAQESHCVLGKKDSKILVVRI